MYFRSDTWNLRPHDWVHFDLYPHKKPWAPHSWHSAEVGPHDIEDILAETMSASFICLLELPQASFHERNILNGAKLRSVDSDTRAHGRRSLNDWKKISISEHTCCISASEVGQRLRSNRGSLQTYYCILPETHTRCNALRVVRKIITILNTSAKVT